MTNWLERFRESEVEIHYLTDNNAYKDRGRLVDYGDGWLELFKQATGETFVIPTTSVRIMKVLAKTEPVENRLLRPVDFEEGPQDIERRRLGDDRVDQEQRVS